MSSRPKRKLEESEDREHDENLRNIPNTETQELYNTMRALEDAITNGIALEHHLQIQSRGGANEYSGHLRLPSPSLAPTSPRSPASTTQSVTGALENVEIHDEEPQPSKKRRAVRHGSLDPVKRAKAALMRKLGACMVCKTRKVKCDHFNRDLFEAGYQATKRQQHLMPAVSTVFSFEPAATTPVTPISQSSDHALSGLGGWLKLQTHVPPTTQPEDQAGQEILLDPPAPSSPTDNRNIVLQNNFALPYSAGLSPSLRAAPTVNTFIPCDSSDPIPIGRHTIYGWECKHGGDDELSVLSHCTVRCHSLPQLLLHFEAMHDSYVTNPFQMWKCIQPTQRDPSRVCGYLLPERSAPCDLCQSTGNARENWCYGTITRTPSLESGSSYSRVPSGDGSTNWTLPNQQHFGTSYGQYDNQMLFPGRQVGGGQTGSHRSYSAAPKSVNCFRGVGVGSVYPRSCPYGGSRCLKGRSTDLGAKASVFSLLVMMLTMLSLGLMPTLSVEAKTKQSLATMLEAAREHVSCMSLACVAAGLVGMWLFKHVKFRLGQDPGDSCHQRCLARDLLGVEPKFDVEDAGSMRGEEMAEVDGEMRGVLA